MSELHFCHAAAAGKALFHEFGKARDDAGEMLGLHMKVQRFLILPALQEVMDRGIADILVDGVENAAFFFVGFLYKLPDSLMIGFDFVCVDL